MKKRALPAQQITPANVRRARRLWMMKQPEFGEAFGYSSALVSRWENGRSPVPACVAIVLNLELDKADGVTTTRDAQRAWLDDARRRQFDAMSAAQDRRAATVAAKKGADKP